MYTSIQFFFRVLFKKKYIKSLDGIKILGMLNKNRRGIVKQSKYFKWKLKTSIYLKKWNGSNKRDMMNITTKNLSVFTVLDQWN